MVVGGSDTEAVAATAVTIPPLKAKCVNLQLLGSVLLLYLANSLGCKLRNDGVIG